MITSDEISRRVTTNTNNITTNTNNISSHTTTLSSHTSSINSHTTSINTLNTQVGRVKTYVGTDGKIHFTDYAGADTALNFSSGDKFHVGDTIKGNLTGSHTVSNYEFLVCCTSSDKIYLLGRTNLGNVTWSTCRNYSWNVTFAAGTIKTTAVSVTGVKIPTHENIYSTVAGYKRDFHYWTSTPYGANAWDVTSTGTVHDNITSASCGAIPYVVISL